LKHFLDSAVEEEEHEVLLLFAVVAVVEVGR
jgi:hypothetical protein